MDSQSIKKKVFVPFIKKWNNVFYEKSLIYKNIEDQFYFARIPEIKTFKAKELPIFKKN
jgi:hypothetical protein